MGVHEVGLLMLPPVFATLKASAAVTNIVGSMSPRIYRHGSAPQRDAGAPPPQPYLTWSLVSGVPENNLSDLPPIDRMTVQIDCWHAVDAGIELLAAAVRDAIEPVAHMTGIVADLREPDTKLFRIGIQFDWWLDR